jgi:hypothetical protein
VGDARLCAAWERDGLAFLAGVFTFDGARQWIFYTRDVAECSERLHAMPQERDRYPIELTTRTDARWEFFRTEVLGPFVEDMAPEELASLYDSD